MSAAAPEPEVSEKCLRSTGPAGEGERRGKRGKRQEKEEKNMEEEKKN